MGLKPCILTDQLIEVALVVADFIRIHKLHELLLVLRGNRKEMSYINIYVYIYLQIMCLPTNLLNAYMYI